MWYGKVILKTPMLYVISFILIFVIGGISGVMVAAVPFDWQVHDTYFVVAHFHYVLIGGAVFPLLGGIHYWFPKITGRMLNERLGRWEVALLFIGFNVAFMPMHVTGFLGMPRRVYTYQAGLGWEVLNVISTIGAFIFAAGVLVFLYNVFRSLQHGDPAGDNPWNAGTLEWATNSPPPPYNFARIPVVHSRDPLWDQRAQVEDVEDQVETDNTQLMMQLDRRETPGTSILDAVPQMRIVLPGPSIVPFLTALAASFTFLSAMINVALIPVGALLVFVTLVMWHWPRTHELSISKAGPPGALPTSIVASHYGSHPPIWWGMILLMLIEAVVFASLVASYFYLRSGADTWPLGNIKAPDLLLPSINALILFASSIPVYLADNGIRKGNQRRLKTGLVIGFIMGVIFLVLKYVEYSGLDYDWSTNAYTSIVWTITGFHSIHVIALLLKTAVMIVLAFRNYFNEERHTGVGANGLYWHFVVAAWVPLFFTIYLSPRLI
jgi:heme/copper-type cytochrome/quinol oxidase subunit 3